MTYTEIIACKLFGWKAAGTKEFVGPHGARVAVEHDRAFDVKPCSTYTWPDLADWNWIRRMEDALAAKGLWGAYILALLEQPFPVDYSYEWPRQGMDPQTYGVWHTTRATADQRVAACVKVLEGQG